MIDNLHLDQIQKDVINLRFEQKVLNERTSNFLLRSINPATQSINCELYEYTPKDIDEAVTHAKRAFDSGVWSLSSPDYRKEILLKFANLIEQNAYTLALLDTIDMGMPIQYSYGMNVKGAVNCIKWFAESIDKVYDAIAPTKYDDLTLITREPIGVVAAITAWNVPLLVAATKIAPALAAGNAVILKPAEQSSLSALRLAELAAEAGLPEGIFHVVTGRGEITGKALALHPKVDCITFTGSTETGKRIQQYAGQSNLKRVCLECGGKSPNIIFDDCYDLDQAAQAAAAAIFFNQGQVCIASSRLLVQENILEDFLPLLLNYAQQFVPGDPLDPKTNFGPLAHESQFNKTLSYIDLGIKEKALLVFGGNNLLDEMGGYFIEPTIFTQVENDMRIAQEEIFGPVLSVITFKDTNQAIKIANNTKYGLGASIWTNDLSKAHFVARALKAGVIRVNTTSTGGFVTPFGGFKESGVGRDKSIIAFNEYTEVKSIIFNLKQASNNGPS